MRSYQASDPHPAPSNRSGLSGPVSFQHVSILTLLTPPVRLPAGPTPLPWASVSLIRMSAEAMLLCGCVLGPAACGDGCVRCFFSASAVCGFCYTHRRRGHPDHSHGGDVHALAHQQVAGGPNGVVDGG